MKISIATGPWFPVPPVQGGAIPRVWQGLAEEFAAKGHQVTILCRSYPGQPDQEVINNVQYIRRGGLPQSPNIWSDLLKDLFYAVTTFSTLPSADILVINDFWLPVFAALRSQVGKIVVNANRFPKGQYFLYEKSACFIAASQAIQEAIIKQYPAAASRVQVIHNPVDIRIFSPPRSPRPEKDQKVILYVGRIHPEKGLHLLIDAFAILSKQLTHVTLRIVGPMKENQGGGGMEYFQNLHVKAQGLQVEFEEPIFDTKRLATAYQAADLFCYPSLAEKGEAFPVAPLEAMATGLVPIVSDLACFKDLIELGKTGYFFEHRGEHGAKNLADTLTKALLNWTETQQMAKNARNKLEMFSYEHIAALCLAEFDNLIKS